MMLSSRVTPHEKRMLLREAMAGPEPLVLPGAFNGLTAQLIQRHGYGGVYISGHMIAADLGLPDLGLTTATEVAERAGQLARLVDVPSIVDADTGFGGPMNTARTVQTLEDAGLAGCHIEDQVNPKRCGHSDGVDVVDTVTAVRRVRAAVDARRDDAFTIIARTDARAVMSLADAIARARAFEDAGADAIFPEALREEREYAAFRAAISVPLVINLNEFGRGAPPAIDRVAELGYDVALYPVTLLRLAMGAVERGLAELRAAGSQTGMLAQMQTKDELYDLLGYDDYARFDDAVFAAGYQSAVEDPRSIPRQ